MLHTFNTEQFANLNSSRLEEISSFCVELIKLAINVKYEDKYDPTEITRIVSKHAPQSLTKIHGKNSITGCDILEVISDVNYNFLIPNGLVLCINYYGKPEVVFASIDLDSLKEEIYLDRLLIHGEMNILFRTSDTCGMTFGNLALSDREASGTSSVDLYEFILSGMADQKLPIVKLLREDFQKQNFNLEDYQYHFGFQRIHYEEVSHAKDNIFVAALNEKLTSKGTKPLLVAKGVLKSDSSLNSILQDTNNNVLIQNVIVEHCAHVMGIISEVREHIQNGAFKLAYYAALDFFLVKTMQSSSRMTQSLEGVYDSASSLFISTLPEIGIRSPKELVDSITTGKYQDRAKACLQILEKIYDKDFLGNKARLRLLA